MPSTKKLLEAAAGSAGGAGLDVADVFSTYLYTGTGNTQSIFNGIDLGPNTGGSISLQASPDGLEIPQSADFNFGTGDLTCEAWIYLEGTSADYRTMFGFDLNGGLLFEVYQMKLDFGIRGGSNTLSTNAVPANQWNHVAIVRSSGTAYWFINGALDKTQANFTNTFSNATKALIGDYSQGGVNFDGSISNLRVSNVARYTSAFTPSTTPLTSDSNTVLLIGQNPDPFLDNSPSSHSVSTYASPAKSGMGPFNGTAGEGGMIWFKQRSGTYNNTIFDTERWTSSDGKGLFTNLTNGAGNINELAAFNSNGFSVTSNGYINTSNSTMASWTFRKSPKFFDVQTYVGNGQASNNISHDLNSIPAFVISKRTDSTGNWNIAARQSDGKYVSGAGSYPTALNLTAVANAITGTNGASDMNLTSTTFDAKRLTGWNSNDGSGNPSNINTASYVAYLFAHNDGDGDFGSDGDQDIIKVGSFTTSGSTFINLGWGPQWVLIKNTSVAGGWYIWDTMRGWQNGNIGNNNDPFIYANSNQAEAGFNGLDVGYPTATGFQVLSFGAGNYIYMAIRAPMIKEPEAATEVFSMQATGSSGLPIYKPANGANTLVDFAFMKPTGVGPWYSSARLIQNSYLQLESTAVSANSTNFGFDYSQGWYSGGDSPRQAWMWTRAKGYMDVVAYTGNNTAGQVIPHSLSVPPEMIWTKLRDTGANNWSCWHSGLGNKEFLILNSNAAKGSNNNGAGWLPTATTFNADYYMGGANYATNQIAYLFATLDGISKLGSVSHSGSSTNVDCGFSNGSSFVMLKRTDAAGDWYAWDSTRGIVAGNDPYMLFNSTAAQVTNTDYIDPLSSGFTITGNFTDGTYIFYAIA